MVWHSNQSQIKETKGKREDKKADSCSREETEKKWKIIQTLYIHQHQKTHFFLPPCETSWPPLAALRGVRFEAHVCVCLCVYMHAYISQMTITTINRSGEQNAAAAASRCMPDSKGHEGQDEIWRKAWSDKTARHRYYISDEEPGTENNSRCNEANLRPLVYSWGALIYQWKGDEGW